MKRYLFWILILESILNATIPVVTSTPVSSVDVVSNYSYTLNATDGNTWDVKSGTTLPSWLELNTTASTSTLVESGLSLPHGVAVDSSGNLYIVDAGNNAIKKRATNGTVTTLINSGLSDPRGIAVDSSGNLYIVDAGNNAIKKRATNGTVTTLMSGVINPIGVAVDSSGNIYIVESGYSAIKKRATDGTVTTLIDSGLSSPSGIAVDSSGNLYIADSNNHAIKKRAIDGTVTTLVSGLNYPYGVAVDSSGNIYITDTYSNAIKKRDINGTVTTLISSGLNNPSGIAVDSNGNIYIADSWNNKIKTIASETKLIGTPTEAGIYDVNLTVTDGVNEVAHDFQITVHPLEPTVTSTPVSSVDVDGDYSYTLTATDTQNDTFTWSITDGQTLPSWLELNTTTSLSTLVSSGLNTPSDIAVDSSGNLYIADMYNNAIKKRDINGTVTTFVSGLNAPRGVAVDSSGNIYIADSNNHAIKKRAPNGTMTTLINSGLNYPNGVSVDSSGNIYIADTGNHAIKKRDVNGTVTNLGISGLSSPFDVTVDSSGNIYIADYGNNAIKKRDVNGTVTTFVSGLNHPKSIMIDSIGNLYIADTSNNALKKRDINGTVTNLGISELNSPIGIVVNGNGNIYIADSGNNKIKMLASETKLIGTPTQAGIYDVNLTVSDGANRFAHDFQITVHPLEPTVTSTPVSSVDVDGDYSYSPTATDAQNDSLTWSVTDGTTLPSWLELSRTLSTSLSTLVESGLNTPMGLAVDSSGNIYIVDTNNHAIKKRDINGTVTNLGISGLSGPTGIAVDSSGNIYIAEYGNNAIKKRDINGTVTTLVSGLNSPYGVAVDSSGNIYIADTYNQAIKKRDVNGTVTTLISSGLSNPRGIALDSSGNLYITDSSNNAIKKRDVNGTVTTLIESGLFNPWSVAVDSSGNLYIADTSNNAIKKRDINGIVTTLISSELSFPRGVAVDSSGNIYIADTNNHKIKTIASDTKLIGTPTQDGIYDINLTVSDGAHEVAHNFQITVHPLVPTVTSTPVSSINIDGNYTYTLTTDRQNDTFTWHVKDGTTLPSWLELNTTTSLSTLIESGLYYPYDVAVDNSSNLYIADTFHHQIKKITIDGVVSTIAGSGTQGSADGTGTAASFNQPKAIVVDSNGNIFVADTNNNKIRKITPDGIVSTIAGSETQGSADGTGTAASFNTPSGITIDSNGNLFVVDLNNNKIRKITPDGIVSTIAGSGTQGSADGTGTAASFFGPNGITIDSSGNLFVADLFNHKIRKITPDGIVSTIAGSGTQGSADGTGTAASFTYPRGITVDSNGNIFVADTNNNKIRKITSEGIVSTIEINSQLSYPSGIEVDGSGNLYIADMLNNKIKMFASKTKLIGTPTQAGIYDVNLTLTDGAHEVAHNFQITVNSLNHTPTNIGLSDSSIAENSEVGTTIGTLSATDTDSGDSFAYSFCGGSDDTSFTITGTTLKSSSVFDYETKSSYSVCVRVSDGTATFDKNITISITDVTESNGGSTPLNGTCGTSNSGSFTTIPTTNLCSVGTENNITSGSNGFSWSCVGANSGSTASCSATLVTYSVTFNSNGGSSVTGATISHNATASTPTQPTKSGYTFGGWYSDSGLTNSFNFATQITANTTLYAKWNAVPVNGSCGTSHNTTNLTTAPTINLCSGGTPTSVVANSTTYTWSCNGANSGTTASCSALKVVPTEDTEDNTTTPTDTNTTEDNTDNNSSNNENSSLNGTCGKSHNTTSKSAPTTNLCSIGTATTPTLSSGIFGWSCMGSNSGVNIDCNSTQSVEDVTEGNNTIISGLIGTTKTTDVNGTTKLDANTTNENNQTIIIEAELPSNPINEVEIKHKVTIGGKETVAISKLEATVDIKADKSVETRTSKELSEIVVVAKEDGKAEHTVTLNNVVSKATSNIIGANTVIDENGTVETMAGDVNTTQNGVTYTIKAVAETKANGKTITKFVKVNVADETDVVLIGNTVTTATPFEAGANVTIDNIDGTLYIKTSAPLDKNLIIE